MAKAAGVALCLAGVLTIALYTGPSMSPVNHHRAFAAHHPHPQAHADGGGKGTWMKGTFLMLLSNMTWSLWIVLQASLLKEYPNKLLSTLVQCGLSTAQSFTPSSSPSPSSGTPPPGSCSSTSASSPSPTP